MAGENSSTVNHGASAEALHAQQEQERGILEFERSSGLSVRRGVDGRSCTTFSIGGSLPFLVEPEGIQDLQRALRTLANFNFPYRILGYGSNLLLPDNGVQECVLRLGTGFRSVVWDGDRVCAGGAAALMTLSREACEAGYSGLEFAGGIPASLGGAVRMNAGAHGGELASRILEVEIVKEDGEATILSATNLGFSYRKSQLPANAVVTRVWLKLQKSDSEQTRIMRAKFLAERKVRQPLMMPSAGSVFKNPEPARSAGMLIESVGLKGFSIGGAQVSELHANWIVNPRRKACAADVIALMQKCDEAVQQSYGIHLEREVITW